MSTNEMATPQQKKTDSNSCPSSPTGRAATDSLAERLPEPLAENMRKFDIFVGRVFLSIMLVACWFPLLTTLLAGKLDIAKALVPATLIIFISIVLSIFVMTMGRYAKRHWKGKNLPVVEYCNDTLTLRSRREMYVAKVEECHLWVGPAHYLRLGVSDYVIETPFLKKRFAPLADRDVILIELLPLYKTFGFFGRVRGYTTAAVGFTDETFAQWVELLGDAIQGPPGPNDYANQTVVTSLDPQSWES